ncbi:aldehyde dehydrogenase family protein [Streptomyces mangrovisoli]|uniref:aldehyde dehydrogenase family protein n=1 Tax=Streptomyces mangrovisoli TaxID=1428628 RepID=UPI000AA04F39|nr:aldehyde dehydrogenase family protein [Streptomyces mangrovisoli]
MTSPTLDTIGLDRALNELRHNARSWTAASLAERIGLLERLLPRIRDTAADLAGAGARAKGYEPDSPWAAEDWTGGPWALAQHVSARLHVLRRLAAGRAPLPEGAVRERDGRTRVTVFPAAAFDRLLLNGYSAEVRIRAGVSADQVRRRAAAPYRRRGVQHPGVALVLGAGNVASLTATDILHKLYAEGQAVLAKMNPVNAYLRPHFERIFAEFIERGWVRFVDGGPAEGAYLTAHDDVDSLHVTGSDRTHDAIVWGTDEHAERRRAADTPLVDKPFTSELGGVSPCVVVPGPWSRADFRYQAEHIVTSKMNNSGHNCIASQVLVVPRTWDGTERLLEEIRRVLHALPSRTDYYPGADRRLGAVLAAHPRAERLAGDGRILVPDITDHDDPLLTEEVFASALGVVRLPGETPAQFLRHATDFCNDVLPGTLGATVIVHPRTERAHSEAFASALDELRYGTIGVNSWSAVGFLLGYTPWGAHPGHTRQAIGSGTGFVNNAFMLTDVEKTVVRAPFAPAPRGLLTGSPSLSPKPPYYVTSRTGLTTVERVTRFTTQPHWARLPPILSSALRA